MRDLACDVVVSIVVVICLVLGLLAIDVKFFDNVPVVCKVDGAVVYRGPSAGIGVSSGGDTTVVGVSGGFLYLFPRARYVSKNVELIGEK